MFRNGNFSPKLTPKRTQDDLLRQLKTISPEKPSSIHKADRFAEKDSLYLDMGKPELNGRVDTLTSGSQNNSLLLQRDPSSNANVGSGSLSAFAKGSNLSDQKKSGQNKSFKNPGGQSFLKAAIFRNMEKNREMGDESKEDPSPLRDKEDFTQKDRRFSEHTPKTNDLWSPTSQRRSSSPENDGSDDISNENPQVQMNVEKIKIGTPDKHPSKMLTSSGTRRFTPFAQK